MLDASPRPVEMNASCDIVPIRETNFRRRLAEQLETSLFTTISRFPQVMDLLRHMPILQSLH